MQFLKACQENIKNMWKRHKTKTKQKNEWASRWKRICAAAPRDPNALHFTSHAFANSQANSTHVCEIEHISPTKDSQMPGAEPSASWNALRSWSMAAGLVELYSGWSEDVNLALISSIMGRMVESNVLKVAF